MHLGFDDKEDLYRAFLPFSDEGPGSPAGVHQFDVVRYDGGRAGDLRGIRREGTPENYTPELWQELTRDIFLGAEFDCEEWAVMNWIRKATHDMDFLGLPAKGKTTHTRGITFSPLREPQDRPRIHLLEFPGCRDSARRFAAARQPSRGRPAVS